MYYDVFNENFKIRKVYNDLEKTKNIKLYIAYFQPYLKVMAAYERVNKLKNLENQIEEFKKEQIKLIEKNNKLHAESEKQKEKFFNQQTQLSNRIMELEKKGRNNNLILITFVLILISLYIPDKIHKPFIYT